MSNDNSIIDIVKDLQERMQNVPEATYHHHLRKFNHLGKIEMDMKQYFPAIIQALLIAVDALEKGKQYRSFVSVDLLEKALSDIRSIPLS